jgi:hypothetical protein
MSDDYLCDRSGDADPEVERLEKLLEEFRYRQPELRLPETRPRPVGRGLGLAALAGLAAVLVAAVLYYERPERGRPLAPPAPTLPSWEVARIAGAPRVDQQTLLATGRLAVGQWLETDRSSRARIRVGTIGELMVGPDTRLRLLEATRSEHRLSLAKGKVHAEILAPPRLFFVETPSAVAVDLGCAYSLEVDEQGSGLLRVTRGFVGFEWEGRESMVPAGASCATRAGRGPGTPSFDTASASLRESLARLDTGDASALGVVLGASRPRDTLTLWHLLSRVSVDDREAVYDRMARLAAPPPEATREAVLQLDRAALEAWRRRLEVVWQVVWKKVPPPKVQEVPSQ